MVVAREPIVNFQHVADLLEDCRTALRWCCAPRSRAGVLLAVAVRIEPQVDADLPRSPLRHPERGGSAWMRSSPRRCAAAALLRRPSIGLQFRCAPTPGPARLRRCSSRGQRPSTWISVATVCATLGDEPSNVHDMIGVVKDESSHHALVDHTHGSFLLLQRLQALFMKIAIGTVAPASPTVQRSGIQRQADATSGRSAERSSISTRTRRASRCLRGNCRRRR